MTANETYSSKKWSYFSYRGVVKVIPHEGAKYRTIVHFIPILYI